MLFWTLNVAFGKCVDPMDVAIKASTCTALLTEKVRSCMDAKIGIALQAGAPKGSLGVEADGCRSKELDVASELRDTCADTLAAQIASAANSREYYYFAQCQQRLPVPPVPTGYRYAAKACYQYAPAGGNDYKVVLKLRDASNGGFPKGSTIVWTQTGNQVAGGSVTVGMLAFQSSVVDATGDASWQFNIGDAKGAIVVDASEAAKLGEYHACTVETYFGSL